jgi:DNA-binding MarR family transcriptional regulator
MLYYATKSTSSGDVIMDREKSPALSEQLIRRRQEHIGRYFWRAHRAFVVLSVRKMVARGHKGLGMAHATLIANLDVKGTRITTLARRMGVTKQAAGHLVADLVEQGYLASSVDPTDKRALLVTFTEKGRAFLHDAYELKGEIEGEFTEILGQERFELLRDTLDELLIHIEDEQDRDES